MPLEKSFLASCRPDFSRFATTNRLDAHVRRTCQGLFLVPERSREHVPQSLRNPLAFGRMFRDVTNQRLDLSRDRLRRNDSPRIKGLALLHLLWGHRPRRLLPSRILPHEGTGRAMGLAFGSVLAGTSEPFGLAPYRFENVGRKPFGEFFGPLLRFFVGSFHPSISLGRASRPAPSQTSAAVNICVPGGVSRAPAALVIALTSYSSSCRILLPEKPSELAPGGLECPIDCGQVTPPSRKIGPTHAATPSRACSSPCTHR